MEKKYVLVVEDSEILIEVIKDVFEDFHRKNPSLDLQYASFISASEAKSFISENGNIACLITDVQLEDDVSGLELATHFCQKVPNVPVYVITRELPKRVFKVMDYPHVKHIPKPLEVPHIEKMFREVLLGL